MPARFAFALAAVFATVTVGAAAELPKPTVVAQAKPVTVLLAQYKEMLRQVGGMIEGEQLVKKFETDLKDALGEKGLEGLDINRPLAAYAIVREKFEDSTLVLVAPTFGEKEFIAFLERMKFKATAVKDAKGLYKLERDDGEIFPKGSHLRFVEGSWAYLTLNDGEPTDPKQLIPVGDLFDNTDLSLFSVKLYPGRVPAKLATGALDELDMTVNGIKGLVGAFIDKKHLAKLATTFLGEGPKLLRRSTETALKEVTEIGLKFHFDPMTGDTLTELTVTPKAGTPLAKEIAANIDTTNRFAGLVPKDAAFGVVVKAPLFAKELREIGTALFEALAEELKDSEQPAPLKAAVDELGKGFIRAAKAGKVDAGLALLAPNKDGKFTLVGGISFDNSTALDKTLRDAAKGAELAKQIEFDAAKVDGVGIHKIPLSLLLPAAVRDDDFEKVFGDKPPAYVAFAKDAIFFAYGPDALVAMKSSLAAKSAPAPLLELSGNMSRLQKAVAAVDPMAGMMFGKYLDTDDKKTSLLRLTAEGGQSLKVKATVNVRYLPRLFLVAEAADAPR